MAFFYIQNIFPSVRQKIIKEKCTILLLYFSAMSSCMEAQRLRGGRDGQEGAASSGYSSPADAPVYRGSGGAIASYGSGPDAELEALAGNIPGTPGEDYPIYAEVPESAFACDGQVDGGYYADPAAECQAFHICTADGQGGLAKYSFLCPNGTIFNQNYFICDWWFNFDCTQAETLYSRNEEIAAEREAASGQSNYGAPPPAGYSAGSASDSSDASSSRALPPLAAPGAQGAYEAAERAGRKFGKNRNGKKGGRRQG